jgi:hypothetical protein
METVNWMAVGWACVLLALACGQFYILRLLRKIKLRDQHLARTVKEIFRAVNQVDYYGSIPPVAVERFMGYITHPDPSFNAAAIIQQELNNQRGGPRGGATLPEGTSMYPDGAVKLSAKSPYKK